MGKITVIALTSTRKYESLYDDELCCGELLRSICVNLLIDPNQEDGEIRNVQFYFLPEGRDGIEKEEEEEEEVTTKYDGKNKLWTPSPSSLVRDIIPFFTTVDTNTGVRVQVRTLRIYVKELTN